MDQNLTTIVICLITVLVAPALSKYYEYLYARKNREAEALREVAEKNRERADREAVAVAVKEVKLVTAETAQVTKDALSEHSEQLKSMYAILDGERTASEQEKLDDKRNIVALMVLLQSKPGSETDEEVKEALSLMRTRQEEIKQLSEALDARRALIASEEKRITSRPDSQT